MSLSVFAEQIESLSREKKNFETKARQKLKEAVSSFIAATEVDPQEVYIKQGGFRRDVEEIDVRDGEFKFEWVIEIAHDGYTLEASVPVYAEQVWGIEPVICLGIGEDTSSGLMEDNIFMKKLIEELHEGIKRAFP